MKIETKQKKALVLILGILLALGLAAGLYFGVRAIANGTKEPSGTQPVNTMPAPETTAGSPVPETTGSVPQTEPEMEETPEMAAAKTKQVYTDDSITIEDPRLDQGVIRCGDYTLSNRDAQIFYVMQYFGFMNEYGMFASMMGLDSSLPFSAQQSVSGDLTWEQYFLMASVEDFRHLAAVATKAASEGYTLPQADRDQMEQALSNMQEGVSLYGFDSIDAFIQANFGSCVRYEDYVRYLELYFYAMSYENGKYEGIEVTEQERSDYYDAHPEDFTGISKDHANVNVRHILIALNTDANASEEAVAQAKEAAKTKAEELLAAFEANPSEEAFAELAKENSEDPGSVENGGLYEGVYPGQMVQPFNDWCFDASRKPGDTGIVETSYGYHVMYFSASTQDYYWKTVADQMIRKTQMTELVAAIMQEYPVTPDYENIVLCPLPQPQTN